jgi:hypothetical protein
MTSSRRPATSVNVPPRLSNLGRTDTLAPWAQQLARTLSPGGPSPPLGARPGRRRPGTRPGARSRRGRRSAGGPPPGCTTSARPQPRHHGLAPARWRPVPSRRPARRCPAVPAGRHHSCALIEAGERGLADVLSSEFDPAPDVLASVLTCYDMTTSPDGQPVPVERRLAEIQGPLWLRTPGEPVHPARHADDPPRSRAGPSRSRADHIATRIEGRPVPRVALSRVALCGWTLAPGMTLLAY